MPFRSLGQARLDGWEEEGCSGPEQWSSSASTIARFEHDSCYHVRDRAIAGWRCGDRRHCALQASLRSRRCRQIKTRAFRLDDARSLPGSTCDGWIAEVLVRPGWGSNAWRQCTDFRGLDATVTIGRDTERLLLHYRGLTRDKVRFITVLVHGRSNDGRRPFNETGALTPRGLREISKAAAEAGLKTLGKKR